jgi:hypothetical protein
MYVGVTFGGSLICAMYDKTIFGTHISGFFGVTTTSYEIRIIHTLLIVIIIIN